MKVSRGKSLRDAAVMGIMKWKLYEELKSRCDNVSMTFGYITKHNRIKYGIENPIHPMRLLFLGTSMRNELNVNI